MTGFPPKQVTKAAVFKEGWHLTQTHNHWSTLDSMKDYVRTIIVPWVNKNKVEHNAPDSHAVLLFDCWSVHKSREFLDWLKTAYPTFHPLFIPAGCTSKAQPADVVLQRPLKHEFSSHYSQWMTNEVSDLLKAGAQPDQIKVDVGLHRMKPLLVKWMMLSWRALSENRDMIKKGWAKAGLGKVMQAEFQLESMNTIINMEPPVNSESEAEEDQASAADMEQRYEDVILDDEDEVSDDEEEVNINDALVAFIEERPVIGVRRSARLQQSESQRADHAVASLLQNEILQDAVRV